MNVQQRLQKLSKKSFSTFFSLQYENNIELYTYKHIRLNLFITQIGKTRFCVKLTTARSGANSPNRFQSRARSSEDSSGCSSLSLSIWRPYPMRPGSPTSPLMYTSSRVRSCGTCPTRSGEVYGQHSDELLPSRNLISTPVHHIERHIDYMSNTSVP